MRQTWFWGWSALLVGAGTLAVDGGGRIDFNTSTVTLPWLELYGALGGDAAVFAGECVPEASIGLVSFAGTAAT